MSAKETMKVRMAKRQKDFIEVFPKKDCNISQTCKAINISRETYNRWYNSNEKFRKAIDEIREAYKDDVESKIYKVALIDENPTMLIWLSKTQLKDRGYIEKQELEHGGSDAFLEVMKEASKLRRQMKDEQD